MIYLTGAGPGDPELLTIKALKAIQRADVIIYDRLANPEILKEAKEEAELIYVGKEDGNHTLPQEEINRVIYHSSLKYEHVVRLKGGDPFVFGRGGEEALYLALKEGKLAGVALDVFEQEPYSGRLKEFDNVIFTPHVGSYAKGTRVKMEIEAVKNLIKGLGRSLG